MSRILGVGTDIVKLGRIRKIILKDGLQSKHTNTFAKKILNTEHELPLFNKQVDADNLEQTLRILAGSWAVKEAVFKCLDDKDQRCQLFKDWYKYNTSNGRPMIGGEYLKNNPNEEFLLSISHDDDTLIATVLRQWSSKLTKL